MALSNEVEALVNQGVKLLASKKYDDAAEKFSNACELHLQETGRDDAGLLFLYGKALFENAVSKSEILGGQSEEQEEEKPQQDDEANEVGKDGTGNFSFSEDVPLAEADEDQVVAAEDEVQQEGPEDTKHDGNQQSASEEHEENENVPKEESEFDIAWDVLDSARGLFEEQLKQHSQTVPDVPPLKGARDEPKDQITKIKKNLADVYDFLGQVSLETENFAQASIDFANCLKYRKELYPAYSQLISESHYMISLALEFTKEEGANEEETLKLEEKARLQAVEHMKQAISCIKQRYSLPETTSKDENLLQDMEHRLQELERDPLKELEQQKMDILKGILGQATSNSSAEKEQDANKPVNDLTGMVRKRKANVKTSPNKRTN
ncbi:hypothetical protein LJB42_003261 [Komagataella kurtzmanii]|nr:hypothetical protein LJB42_003261 [Komagataella kurtzmanii]